MSQADGEYKSGMPSPTPASKPLLTWPAAVQIALCLILTATLFFILGRVTTPQPSPTAAPERGAPVLDLNRATKAELRLLPGLGDALAGRVVEYRDRHGRFASVEDLRYVAGIGPKTLDRLRPWLFVTREEYFTADEDSEPIAITNMPMSPDTQKSKKLLELTGSIDVNHASRDELQKLPGIGPKLSQRIIDERTKSAFKSVEELRRVPGIGPKTLEKVRPFVKTSQGD